MAETITELGERELPYASMQLPNGKYLVTGYFGTWTLLSPTEFQSFKAKQYSPALKQKIENAGLIINKDNAEKITQRYMGLTRHLLLRPSLHIINITNKCNYRCNYCHTGVSQGKDMMTGEVAAKIVKFILENSGDVCTIEFQGGEALLNWPVVKFIIEQAITLNKSEKDLRITLVSNLSLMTPEKLDFLIENDVQICTSLDGPANVHDKNRKKMCGAPTQEHTVGSIRQVNNAYKKANKHIQVGALTTVTKDTLAHPKEVVDCYVDLGLPVIHLRGLHNLGDALGNWETLQYTPEEFVEFWKQALDYIIDLNKKGTTIIERQALNILMKVLAFKDPLYIEFMSPTGAGRGTLLYDYDGGIFSSDEGRMVADDIFKIGTVDDPPKDVFGNDDLINTWAATFMDLFCYNSPLRPWMGTHPVLNYQTFGNIIPRMPETFWHKVYTGQFTYIFEKLCDPEAAQIFKKWVLQSS